MVEVTENYYPLLRPVYQQARILEQKYIPCQQGKHRTYMAGNTGIGKSTGGTFNKREVSYLRVLYRICKTFSALSFTSSGTMIDVYGCNTCFDCCSIREGFI